VLAGLTGLWALGVWAFLMEPELLLVRAETLASATWREPPLRIGLIAGTHGGSPHMDGARMERVVARMNALQPDVVVLLGD
jgi:predicted MPP superfamily phosphohydrolase